MAFADDSDNELLNINDYYETRSDIKMVNNLNNLSSTSESEMTNTSFQPVSGEVTGNLQPILGGISSNIQPFLGGIDSNVQNDNFSTLNRKDLQLLCKNSYPKNCLTGNNETSDNSSSCIPEKGESFCITNKSANNKILPSITSNDTENIDQDVSPFQVCEHHLNGDYTNANVHSTTNLEVVDKGNTQNCESYQTEKSSETKRGNDKNQNNIGTAATYRSIECNVPERSDNDCEVTDTNAFEISPSVTNAADEVTVSSTTNVGNVTQGLGNDNQISDMGVFIISSCTTASNKETLSNSNLMMMSDEVAQNEQSNSQNESSSIELEYSFSMENVNKHSESSSGIISKETTEVSKPDSFQHGTNIILQSDTNADQCVSMEPISIGDDNDSINNDECQDIAGNISGKNVIEVSKTDSFQHSTNIIPQSDNPADQCVSMKAASIGVQNDSLHNDEHKLQIDESEYITGNVTGKNVIDNKIDVENETSIHTEELSNDDKVVDKTNQIIISESDCNTDSKSDHGKSYLVISDDENDDCCIVEEGTDNIRVQDIFSLRTDYNDTDDSNGSGNDLNTVSSNIKGRSSTHTDAYTIPESTNFQRECNYLENKSLSTSLDLQMDYEILKTALLQGTSVACTPLVKDLSTTLANKTNTHNRCDVSTDLIMDRNITSVSSDTTTNVNIANAPININTGQEKSMFVIPNNTTANTSDSLRSVNKLRKKNNKRKSLSKQHEKPSKHAKGILNCDVYIVPQHFINTKLLLCKKVPKHKKDEHLCFDNVMLMSWDEWTNIYSQCEDYQEQFGVLYENLQKQHNSATQSLKNHLYDIDIETFETTVVDQSLVCSECGFSFKTETAHRSHLLSYHGDVFQPVTNLPTHGKNSTTLINSALNDSGSADIFKCNICHIVCTNRVNLEFHKQLRHMKDSWIGSSKLERMLSVEQQKEKEVCPQLPKEITVPFVAGKKNRKTCKLCDTVASCKFKLMQHFYNAHGLLLEKSNVKCDECNSILSNKQSLRKHMRTHKAEGYSCKECLKTFETFTQLGNHEILDCNSRQNLFRCSKCAKPRYFDSKEKLRNHELGHCYSGVKRHFVD